MRRWQTPARLRRLPRFALTTVPASVLNLLPMLPMLPGCCPSAAR
jgi:hypothetical protein